MQIRDTLPDPEFSDANPDPYLQPKHMRNLIFLQNFLRLVSDPKRFFSDPDPTFEVIPDPGPVLNPGQVPDTGQHQFFFKMQYGTNFF